MPVAACDRWLQRIKEQPIHIFTHLEPAVKETLHGKRSYAVGFTGILRQALVSSFGLRCTQKSVNSRLCHKTPPLAPRKRGWEPDLQ